MSDDKYQRFSDRFFEVSPLYTRPGWYIKLREGNVIGPFMSKTAAQVALFNLFGIADRGNQVVAERFDSPSTYSINSRK